MPRSSSTSQRPAQRRRTVPKKKVSCPSLPMQRQFSFLHEGRYFDLKDVFNRLNARYFGNALQGYTITWGRRRKLRPKMYLIFGSIQEEDRLIRIHPLLDSAWVPRWFLEYVIYHEMLHAVVPDGYDAKRARRVVHTPEFALKERRFPSYARARRWESENIARFLR